MCSHIITISRYGSNSTILTYWMCWYIPNDIRRVVKTIHCQCASWTSSITSTNNVIFGEHINNVPFSLILKRYIMKKWMLHVANHILLVNIDYQPLHVSIVAMCVSVCMFCYSGPLQLQHWTNINGSNQHTIHSNEQHPAQQQDKINAFEVWY